ncbi:hypothetical protein D6T69_14305 [Tenacibaculum singaporense]|uniref:Uncharacterized protein n=1 Tax=Tenacibaculum singaporense TaxID=2358479 RepID=A0A3S8RA43_9FLAO|nr:hypothetical protein D6T69_14305 [Tenacibaculum singaporense]
MKKPLIVGVVNLVFTLLLFMLLISFGKEESVFLLLLIFLLILLGIILSTLGWLVGFKYLKSKLISRTAFLFSLFLNSFFPLIILILILSNLKDVLRLF